MGLGEQQAGTEGFSAGLQVGLLATMLRIRCFEERTEELYRAGELPGFVHLSIGQEACAAGACAGTAGCFGATGASRR